MYKRSEGFFKGFEDVNLFFQLWDNPNAQGTIIITHGHGEHSESYSRLVKGFEDDKWSFYAWDLRGHGRSDGRRGYVSDFNNYCKDFQIFHEMLLKKEQVKKGPIVLLCHSMGALIQFKSLMLNPKITYDAIVVSSPLFGLTLPVPLYKSVGAVVLKRLLPQVTMGNEISNDMLTQDYEVIREFEQDALRHTKMSSAVFLGFLDSFDYVNSRASEIKKPTLFLLPENDPVVSSEKAKEFFNKLGSSHKQLFIYPQARHEVFNDIMRNTVFADMKKFLVGILESKK